MIDRLISGAGAVSHLADRIVRAFLRGDTAATRPVGLVLAAILGVGAIGGLAIAAENSGDQTLRELTAADVAGRDHGDRSYTTIAGGLVSAYVETFRDDNADGQQQPDEKGEAWNYFLVDPATRAGVTVQSDRPPAEVYTLTARGVVVDDAAYVAEDATQFKPWVEEVGLTLEPSRYVDTTKTGSFTATALADGLPAGGEAVEISGSRSIDYLTVCSSDPDKDGVCSEDEVDFWDVLVYDPVSKKAVTVLTSVSPEFSPASFTGLLRRSPARVTEAQRMDNDAFQLSDMNVTVSPDYLLDDGDRPTNPIALLIPSFVALVVAAVVVIGALGGLLRFRPGGGWPSRVASFAPGERMPVHVTGALRTATGLTQVREADADLVRYVMAPAPVPAPVPQEAPVDAASEPADPTAPSADAVAAPADGEGTAPAADAASTPSPDAAPVPADPPTTLILERRGAAARGRCRARRADRDRARHGQPVAWPAPGPPPHGWDRHAPRVIRYDRGARPRGVGAGRRGRYRRRWLMDAWELADLEAARVDSGKLYHEFFSVPDLSGGLYVLEGGATDPQSPHTEDELYVVMSGRAKVMVDGDVRPIVEGSVVFVAAHAVHRFIDIEERLVLLVVFGPAEYSRRGS